MMEAGIPQWELDRLRHCVRCAGSMAERGDAACGFDWFLLRELDRVRRIAHEGPWTGELILLWQRAVEEYAREWGAGQEWANRRIPAKCAEEVRMVDDAPTWTARCPACGVVIQKQGFADHLPPLKPRRKRPYPPELGICERCLEELPPDPEAQLAALQQVAERVSRAAQPYYAWPSGRPSGDCAVPQVEMRALRVVLAALKAGQQKVGEPQPAVSTDSDNEVSASSGIVPRQER